MRLVLSLRNLIVFGSLISSLVTSLSATDKIGEGSEFPNSQIKTNHTTQAEETELKKVVEHYENSMSMTMVRDSDILLKKKPITDESVSKALVLLVTAAAKTEEKDSFSTTIRSRIVSLVKNHSQFLEPSDKPAILKFFSEEVNSCDEWFGLGGAFFAEYIGRKLSDKDRNQAAADCFLRSKTPEALQGLGVLIYEGKVNSVAGKEFKSQEDRDQAAAAYYRESNTPESLLNLELMKKKALALSALQLHVEQ